MLARMKRVMVLLVIAALVVTAEAKGKKDPRDAQLAELATAVGCPSEDAPQRVWCLATDGWAKGKPAKLANGDHVMLGLTIELVKGGSVADELSNSVSVSALALHVAKGKVSARLTNVKPESADEEQAVAEAVAGLAVLYKGKADTAEVPKALYDYAQTLPANADHKAKKGKKGWTFTGESSAELRKVGDVWVAIEVPAAGNGVWVSIFTDKLSATSP